MKWIRKGPTHTWIEKHQHHKLLATKRELLYINVPLIHPTEKIDPYKVVADSSQTTFKMFKSDSGVK
jgi:hypothetical protein